MSAASPTPAPAPRQMMSSATTMLDDETALVELEGELDLWSAPQLKGTLCDLLAAGQKRLVVDLAHVPFMDSTALGVLVGIDRRLADDQRLAIAQPTGEVLRLFELSGVAATFRIFPTREAAITYLALDHDEARGGTPPLTADAALLLGIAATAMPFARSAEEQAERWLRALRRHGEAGAVLASLGVQEEAASRLDADDFSEPFRAGDADVVAIVTDHAGQVAVARGAAKVSTTDVLVAVTHVYGETFGRVLAAHGVTLDELRAGVASGQPAAAESQA